MAAYERIVVLTGAGLSAESGIATFRDKGGVWSKYDVREVATPEGYARNPLLVHEFYNMRRRDHALAKPNAAHFALARLEREHPGVLSVAGGCWFNESDPYAWRVAGGAVCAVRGAASLDGGPSD